MNKTRLILFLLPVLLLTAACKKQNTPEPKPELGESYPDQEVFRSIIPYPCNDWQANQKEIEAWETAHGGILNPQKSAEYTEENSPFLWFDVPGSKANPVRAYYLSGRTGLLTQAMGYYDPCSLVVNEEGTEIMPDADRLLTESGYEYSGIVQEGYFQYTSSRVGKILRIARIEHGDKLLAFVAYLRKP